MTGSVIVAITASTLAVLLWLALFARILLGPHDRRHTWLVMPSVGLVAAVGTLASAIGFAESSGTISVVIDQGVLSLVASMGRGALAMGAFIALMVYRPGAQ